MANNPLAPIAPESWSTLRARHLLNRAGFGIPEEKVVELAAMAPEQAVASLVNVPSRTKIAPAPACVVPAAEAAEFRKALRGLPEEERRKKQQEIQRRERQANDDLTTWWVERMSTTDQPIEEKLTLLWQGHFATSFQKVKPSSAMYHYNETLRIHALGNIKDLTIAVGQSPAMLIYLDNAKSTKKRPNENWARELMELFTMGVGNYTEQDIKESARAFTGWAFAGSTFQYREANHDFGEKTFLGVTGPLDGWDVIDIIFEQPATSRLFAKKLWTYFAYEHPSDSDIDALAAELRANNFDIKPTLQTLFQSESFYNERAMGHQIKSPAQFVTQLAYDLHLDPVPAKPMARAMANLGQNPLAPPNVKGWDGGRAWINANTLLTRYNLPVQLASAPIQKNPDMMMNDTMMAPDSAAEPAMTGEGDGKRARKAAAGRAANSKTNLLKAMLRTLPEDERQAWMEKLEAAESPADKEQISLSLLMKVNPEGVWRPEFILGSIDFETAGQCIDSLVARYLVREPLPEQSAVLLQALGATSREQPLTFESMTPESMSAALHLLFSMAEYQLC